jgi:site-specific DNA-methyltransferase (adenine-specific)
MPKIEIFNEDCMIGMERFPDKYFELAIVDPEYGIKLSGPCGHFKQYGGLQKINKNPPDEKYFNQLFRVSKNQIIFGGNYFTLPPNRCFIVWDKGASMYGRSFAECELCWASFDEVARIVKIFPNQHGRTHPTQKPVKLYEWLLRNYAKKGDKILDTHLGSGSSAIACYNLDFDFIGFEIDKEYYDGAMKRLEEKKKYGRLKPLITQQEHFNLTKLF